MITGLSVQDANPESSISSHWKDLHSDESFGPTFSFDSAALYLPTLHSKADTQAFSFAGNVEAIACCSSASVPTSDSQVGIADAAKPQISWEPALAPAGTTYNTSISSSLLCYKATLGSDIRVESISVNLFIGRVTFKTAMFCNPKGYQSFSNSNLTNTSLGKEK